MIEDFEKWGLKKINKRIVGLVFVLLLQLLLVFSFLVYVSFNNDNLRMVLYLINIFVMIKVIYRHENSTYKLAWIIIILVLPFVGGLVYLLFAERKIPKALRNKVIVSTLKSNMDIDKNDFGMIGDEDIKDIYEYINHNGLYPYYRNTESEYFDSGEAFFDSLLSKLKKAKYFVFIEFYIIRDGYMLNTLIESLSDCVKRGVKVYMIYDDVGSIIGLSKKTIQRIKEDGIEIVAFSPITIRLSLLSLANNRSHHKIVVIDNYYGYTGGFNLSDEYINRVKPYGHWKDTGIMIKGEATYSLTTMFINFYNACVKEEKRLVYDDFRIKNKAVVNDAYILAFSSSPNEDENLGRMTHLNIIKHAKKYLYIQTPYLVIDSEVTNALCIAAKSGVDVIITTPHIPDKKIVFEVTKSHYQTLLEAGVKIYEYSPGFMHSKLMISDDKIAMIGTINLDYRSYYLNYEDAILIANDLEVIKMKEDYQKTLNVSKQISLYDEYKTKYIIRLMRAILNVFALLL